VGLSVRSPGEIEFTAGFTAQSTLAFLTATLKTGNAIQKPITAAIRKIENGSARTVVGWTTNREEKKMHKQYEEQPSRIEREDDAAITFTIALHGPHAWEILLEDNRRYHSISHGWAADNPHAWEDAVAPLLRRFFAKN